MTDPLHTDRIVSALGMNAVSDIHGSRLGLTAATIARYIQSTTSQVERELTALLRAGKVTRNDDVVGTHRPYWKLAD